MQHTGQGLGIGQPQVQALACQGVDVVGRVARQHPAVRGFARAGQRAAPAGRLRLLQRPRRAGGGEFQPPQCALAGGFQLLGKRLGLQRQQRGDLLAVYRPDHGHRPTLWAVQRQEGEDAIGQKPLPGHLAVRVFALQPGGDGVLGVGGDFEIHAELGPGAAGAPFAHHRQGSVHGGLHHLYLGLVAHGFGQTLLQGRHVHNPGQRLGALGGCVEVHRAILVAKHVHAGYGRGVLWVRPAAQGFKQGAGCGVQCVRAHIGCCGSLRCGVGYQCHTQALACQQQGQGAADDAGPTDTNVKGVRHAGIVGAH